MNTRFAVVIGLDVGKSGHHACALYLDGEKVFDKPLPQDEATLRDLFTALGEQAVVVPATVAVELMIPRVAGQVKELKEQQATVARRSRACWRTFLSPRS